MGFSNYDPSNISPKGKNLRGRLYGRGGCEATCCIESMKKPNKVQSYEDLSNVYNYNSLSNIFPNIRTYRAGFLCLYTGHSMVEVLMVKEKGQTFRDAHGIHVKPEHFGLPKGHAESQDTSALDTATRELYEETGINVRGMGNARLMPTVFVIHRVEGPISEIIVYFIVILNQRPPVVICKKELCDYAWINLRKETRLLKDATIPTKKLFAVLENVKLSESIFHGGIEI